MKGQKVIFSSVSDEWGTPDDVYEVIRARFFDLRVILPGSQRFNFDIDAAATEANRKCERFYSKENSALNQPLTGAVWCNPPYSQCADFVEHFATSPCIGAMLLPSRTDTKWFQKFLIPRIEDVYFWPGRIKFVGGKHSAPFPSLVWYKWSHQ